MVRKNPFIYYTQAYEDVKQQNSIDIVIILLQLMSTTSHPRIEKGGQLFTECVKIAFTGLQLMLKWYFKCIINKLVYIRLVVVV